MKLKCSECGAKVQAVYPLNGKEYCDQCVPKEYRKLYPDWKAEKKERSNG